MARLHALGLFAAFLVAACTASGPGGPGACDASAQCACTNAACTCQGDGRCDSVCADNCQVACTSRQGCTAACGANCSATCSGPGHCVFRLGNGSTAVCTADQSCEVTCYGTCRVTSSGNATSTVVTCMSGTRTDCGGGLIACGLCN